MAGFHDFNSKAWRERFLNQFFMKRNPQPPPATSPDKEERRYSMEVSSEFKSFLDEKRKQTQSNTAKGGFVFDEDKENVSGSSNKQQNTPSKKTLSSAASSFEETFEHYKGALASNRVSDDSFEALEKMCDKTASDPNSTLFRYLNSDEQEAVLNDVKKRALTAEKVVDLTTSADEDNDDDAEAAALRRLLDDLRMDSNYDLSSESPLKGVEITQLEDVEEPSRLWEATLTTGDSIAGLPTSPVKMVGLMRPSTILENDGSCDEEEAGLHDGAASRTSNSSSATNRSYQTANDNRDDVQSVASSSGSYGTATDVTTIRHSTSTAASTTVVDSTILLIDLNETLSPSAGNSRVASGEEHEPAIEDAAAITVLEASSDGSSSENDSVIEVLSEGNDDDDDTDSEKKETTTEDEEEMEPRQQTVQRRTYASAVIVNCDRHESRLPSLPVVGCNQREEDSEDSLSADESNMPASHDTSANVFDNTLEEVEYMMQKGLEFMRAAGQTQQQPPPPPQIQQTPITFSTPLFLQSSKSPSKKSFFTSPSPRKALPMLATQKKAVTTAKGVLGTPATMSAPATRTPTKCLRQPTTAPGSSNTKPNVMRTPSNSGKSFAQQLKAFPKLDIFSKPSGIPKRANDNQLRSQMAGGRQQFAHVASPIRVYVNNTGTTPLMSTFKGSAANQTLLNATGFRELQEEERQMLPPMKLNTARTPLEGDSSTSHKPCSLPKKAYISSDLKHVVDERTPVTIPGGPTMQKYVQSAMLPAIVRHEGKIKLPTSVTSKLPMQKSMRAQCSIDLADLSVASGDMSVYTIKDAQKFSNN